MNQLKMITLLACLTLSSQASGEDDLFTQADKAARAGDTQAMLQVYEQILRAEPQNVRAMNGRATALGWDGQYDKAVYAYQQALLIEPANLESLIGLGYARAWAGEYAGALQAFRRALTVQPDYADARKGEAYVYLWSGELDRAAQEFESLTSAHPEDPEVLVALAQTRLQRGENRAAASAFDRALAADPARDDAFNGRKSAYNATPLAEVGLWYGSTSSADSGLRQAELAYWLSQNTRLVARYDDSLSLDNPELARRGDNATTWLAGLMHRFGTSWTANVELGQRDLPDGDQSIYRTEVMWTGELARLTLGAQLGDHDLGYEDKLSYFGVAVPVGDRWQIESNSYFSSTGVEGIDEWRSIINAEYKADAGWSVLVGGGYGEIDATATSRSDNVKVAHVIAYIPIFGYHRLNLTFRHEEVAGANFDTAVIGFMLRLPHN